jgi:hypothetical protein
MKKITFASILALCAVACNSTIKNSDAKIEIEKGTEISDENAVRAYQDDEILGFWVGYFLDSENPDMQLNEKSVFTADHDGQYWLRENKINISIDKIEDNVVIGHSVVAGNNRPFEGVVENGIFKVKEPGDDKYDGMFTFQILDNKLTGTWTAYNDIEIKNRNYSLEKMTFTYNPDIMLVKTQKNGSYHGQFIDWNKQIEEMIEYGEGKPYLETTGTASATELIFTINASNTLLKKSDVENLTKGDLIVIRNTIYARHGYSFKNRPLRVFFDAQPWYIPVHADIKADFTDIEKENIQLLLKYEKNAIEYYDYFGR